MVHVADCAHIAVGFGANELLLGHGTTLSGSSSRALGLHGSRHHESWPVPGAAFASGPAIDVSGETFGQARGKARAIRGIRSPVIGFRDDHDRSIKSRFRDKLTRSEDAIK